jgi:hypothetical protein
MTNDRKSSDSPPTLLVVLTHESDPARITAELPAFLRLSDEVTFGLEELVERWESKAAPVSRLGSVRGLPPTTPV